MSPEPPQEPTLAWRATVPAMEARLGVPIPCLDHGFVRVVDYMGDDNAIVQAARVSYGPGTRTPSQDRDLIRYLMRHRHTSPFEMCELKLHVKLPIFVARQWIRHRTASVNELSGRYSVLDREFYLPRPEHLARQAVQNKQGRGQPLEAPEARRVLEVLEAEATRAHGVYEHLLEDHDLARELARMNLSLGFYTQWYWKIDLHNLLHFQALRMDAHAQQEIRVYAEAIASVLQSWVPLTWEAFTDYRLEAATLSRQGVLAVRRLLRGQPADPATLGLTRREWADLCHLLHLDSAGRPLENDDGTCSTHGSDA